MQLAKTQRNAIFHAIVAGGLRGSDCSLAKMDNGGITIVHSPTDSRMWIGPNRTPFKRRRGICPDFVEYPADLEHLVFQMKLGDDPRLPPSSGRDWNSVLAAVQEWAQAVYDWTGTPDIWDMVSNQNLMAISWPEDVTNTLFTEEEAVSVSKQLTAVRDEIERTYSLTKDQMTLLRERIDETEKASRRVGRKDWFALLMGTLFSLIISGVITPDIAHHAIAILLHHLGRLFSGGPGPISR